MPSGHWPERHSEFIKWAKIMSDSAMMTDRPRYSKKQRGKKARKSRRHASFRKRKSRSSD